MKQPVKQSPEAQLVQDIAKFYDDPLGFVHYAFPWGETGTILSDHTGPDTWQADILGVLGDESRRTSGGATRIAVTSGHGIGKSAEVAWIILWFMSTRTNPQIVVTANTRSQLLTKTWRELSRWHKMAINNHWFEWTATKFYMKEHPSTWAANAIPWSKENSEAFAGTHEEHVLVIYDEASGVDDVIWEVTEGAMTTPGAFWVAFGNPTRNTGRFRECWGKFSHRWITRQIDSRTAKMANRAQLDQWIEDYGEDSDFARVRVKGQFPRASSAQFIPGDIVERAFNYRAEGYEDMPKILGVDVARFGDDQSVIVQRQGTRILPLTRFRNMDTMTLAAKVSEFIDEWAPDAVFVDGIGIGAGVVDRLRQMNYDVFDVQVGQTGLNDEKYYNKRAEVWGNMRDWLKGSVELPRDKDLYAALTGIEYGFDMKGRIQLEKKSDMKKRGLPSPDEGDAIALTFAEPVRVKMNKGVARSETGGRSRNLWRYL